MNPKLWPILRAVAPAAILTVALPAAGCLRKPAPLTDPSSQRTRGEVRPPEPREGLTFRYHGAGDGANTDGPIPSTSWTEIEVSDGSEVRAYQHSFKRPEYAEQFYSDKIAGGRVLLQEAAPAGVTGLVAGRRAVIEYAARGGETRGAILELRGRSVSEIVGLTAGHALAYEKWRGMERQ